MWANKLKLQNLASHVYNKDLCITFKESVAHTHIRVLLSGNKQWRLEFCMQMDGNKKHYPKWDNPDPKRWIWYVLNH